MPQISVIIPAHNEEENLPLLFSKIKKTFLENNIDGEVIFVDDGSTDKTKTIAQKLAEDYPFLKVIHHPRKEGISKALNTGFKNVNGDIIVYLPSDLQSDPEEDIPKLLGPISEGYDVVVGWRKKWERPTIKILESKIYSFMSRKLFGVNIHDFNWIRAFKSEVITDLHLRKDWHRYFVVLVASKGYKVGEVEVNEYPRKLGRSKFNATRVLTGFLDLLAVKFYLSFTEKPMLLFGVGGVLLITIGTLSGLYMVYLHILGLFSMRSLLFVIVLVILMGVQLFAIGFLAEMLVALREDLNKK